MMKELHHLLIVACLIPMIVLLSCGSALANGSANEDEKYWKENYAISGRNCGNIGKMKGNIQLICVFVTDSHSSWTGPAIDEMYNGLWTT